MPKVIAQQVGLDLTLDQVLSIVRQLKPQEQEVMRRVIEPPPEPASGGAVGLRVGPR